MPGMAVGMLPEARWRQPEMGSQISSATSTISSGSACSGPLGGADLADADADGVVQPPVGLAVGQVEHGADDLAAPGRIGTPVPVPLDHDDRPVVGLDHSAEVRPERAVLA